jgi:erythromycin esterase-like protein
MIGKKCEDCGSICNPDCWCQQSRLLVSVDRAMKTDTETDTKSQPRPELAREATDTVTISRECALVAQIALGHARDEQTADVDGAYYDEIEQALEKGHGETKKIGLWLHNLHLILFWFCFSIVILTLI